MRPLVTLFGAYNAQLGGKMKLYKVIHRALISTAVFGALTIPAKADVDMSGKINRTLKYKVNEELKRIDQAGKLGSPLKK